MNERPLSGSVCLTANVGFWVGPAENEAQVLRNSQVNRLKDATRQLI